MRLGGKKEKKKAKVVGQLRRTQLITTFGCGAIADMPDYSVIIGSTDYWKDSTPIIREPNLEKLLGMDYFKQPLVTESNDGCPNPDIPAYRFPIMHFCPSCNKLMPYWGFTGDEGGKMCSECRKKIVPSRFIAACVNGHIEDFPYNWWVHHGDLSTCKEPYREDKLRIEFTTDSGGLESIVVKCTACEASRTMAGSMGKDALKGYKCHGHRPWIGLRKEYNDLENCNAPMRGLQRGASNVYFTVTASALTIPPWSGRIQAEIEKQEKTLKPLINLGIAEEQLDILLRTYFSNMINTDFCTLGELKAEIKRRFDDPVPDEYTEHNLLEEEYAALCKANNDDEQFKAEQTEVSDYLQNYFSEIVLVKRLREILALQGFRRVFPDAPSAEDERFQGYNREKDFVSLSRQPMNWLPAIEMLGEGIFIRLNEEKIQKWEEKNIGRYDEMGRRLGNSYIGHGKFSARYVLLHTLSHLLIRQLSIECGYSGASIKERIYSTYSGSEKVMSGILLYTSSSDSDGSLGGLVRMGLPEQFENIVRNMLQESAWCSSDPICIQSKSQGFNSLNYAACHACTLLPETSCEAANCLLDRASVVGTLEEHEIGFMGELLGDE